MSAKQSVRRGRWDSKWSVRTAIGKDGWTAEARVPYEAFGVTPKPGDRWGFNLTRRDGKKGRRGELVGWTQNMGFDRETRLFGELVFE